MGKSNLVERTVEILENSSFNYSYPYTASFDIFASKENLSLVIKILENIDSLDRYISEDMKRLSKFLDASPFLIGDHSSQEALENNVIHKRHDLPALNPETFEKVIKRREKIFLIHGKGGYQVKLNPEKVKEKRKERGISINRLSKETGISSRTLLNYERSGKASLEKAKELEKFLGDVIGNLDLLNKSFEFKARITGESKVAKKLIELGLSSLDTKKAPFDVCAKDEDNTYTIGKENPNKKLIKELESLEEVIPSSSFFISDKKDYFGELPALSRKELEKFKDKDDLKESVCA